MAQSVNSNSLSVLTEGQDRYTSKLQRRNKEPLKQQFIKINTNSSELSVNDSQIFTSVKAKHKFGTRGNLRHSGESVPSSSKIDVKRHFIQLEKSSKTDPSSPTKKRRLNSFSCDSGTTSLQTFTDIGDCVAQRTRSKTLSPQESSKSAENFRSINRSDRIHNKNYIDSINSSTSNLNKNNLLNYYRKTRNISRNSLNKIADSFTETLPTLANKVKPNIKQTKQNKDSKEKKFEKNLPTRSSAVKLQYKKSLKLGQHSKNNQQRTVAPTSTKVNKTRKFTSKTSTISLKKEGSQRSAAVVIGSTEEEAAHNSEDIYYKSKHQLPSVPPQTSNLLRRSSRSKTGSCISSSTTTTTESSIGNEGAPGSILSATSPLLSTSKTSVSACAVVCNHKNSSGRSAFGATTIESEEVIGNTSGRYQLYQHTYRSNTALSATVSLSTNPKTEDNR